MNCEGTFESLNKSVNLKYLLSVFAYSDQNHPDICDLFSMKQRMITFKVVNDYILKLNEVSCLTEIEERIANIIDI